MGKKIKSMRTVKHSLVSLGEETEILHVNRTNFKGVVISAVVSVLSVHLELDGTLVINL